MREQSSITMAALTAAALACACGEDVVVATMHGDAGDADTDADADGDTDADTEQPGCAWQVAYLGLLSSVWAASADEVYAVGGSTFSDSLAFRFDGGSWQALPDPGTVVPMGLLDVWGFATGEIACVGDFMVALHFDGTSWTTSNTQNAFLRGVWGAARDDIWAVGGVLDTVVMHYDGTAWSRVPGADLPAVGPLDAVWGDGSGEVVAVANGAILRFDGQEWAAMDTSAVGDSYLTIFQNVWGLSMSDFYVVGRHGLTADGVVLRYDGGQWQQQALGPAAEGAALRGVHGGGPGDVWVVGERDGQGVMLRYDGGGWSEIEGPFSFPLNEVWVAGPQRVFAVGDFGAVWCGP